MATKNDHWVSYNNQGLREGDWVTHSIYGVCKVEVSTPTALKLLTKKDRIKIHSDRSFITHYWDAPSVDRG